MSKMNNKPSAQEAASGLKTAGTFALNQIKSKVGSIGLLTKDTLVLAGRTAANLPELISESVHRADEKVKEVATAGESRSIAAMDRAIDTVVAKTTEVRAGVQKMFTEKPKSNLEGVVLS